MTTKTYEQVKTELRQIASESPEYVYSDHHEECYYYNPDGSPACIVGHWLWRYLGMDLPALRGAVSRTDSCNFDSVRLLGFDQYLGVEGDAVTLLDRAQQEQDKGAAWREAVEDAIQSVEEWRV